MRLCLSRHPDSRLGDMQQLIRLRYRNRFVNSTPGKAKEKAPIIYNVEAREQEEEDGYGISNNSAKTSEWKDSVCAGRISSSNSKYCCHHHRWQAARERGRDTQSTKHRHGIFGSGYIHMHRHLGLSNSSNRNSPHNKQPRNAASASLPQTSTANKDIGRRVQFNNGEYLNLTFACPLRCPFPFPTSPYRRDVSVPAASLSSPIHVDATMDIQSTLTTILGPKFAVSTPGFMPDDLRCQEFCESMPHSTSLCTVTLSVGSSSSWHTTYVALFLVPFLFPFRTDSRNSKSDGGGDEMDGGEDVAVWCFSPGLGGCYIGTCSTAESTERKIMRIETVVRNTTGGEEEGGATEGREQEEEGEEGNNTKGVKEGNTTEERKKIMEMRMDWDWGLLRRFVDAIFKDST